MVTKKPSQRPTRAARKTDISRSSDVWDDIVALGKSIPSNERAKMPRDGAKNFDHYLDGSPKQP